MKKTIIWALAMLIALFTGIVLGIIAADPPEADGTKHR